MKREENRRVFLKRISTAVLGVQFFVNCATGQKSSETNADLELIRQNAIKDDCSWCGAKEVPGDVGWRSIFKIAGEKGDPLIISGSVFLSDGKTPASNILIYAYHTDTEGIYGRPGEPKHGRFRGWMLTDEKGRYEFRTIKPASYPNSTISAHIHMTLTGKNFKEDWIDSILFEGDRFITQREREMAGRKGGFDPILRLEKGADGIFRGVRNIQLMS